MAKSTFPAPMPLDKPSAPGNNPERENESPGDGRYTQDALPYDYPSRKAKGDLGLDSLPKVIEQPPFTLDPRTRKE